MAHADIGALLGRSERACRIRLHKLLPIYRDKGYEGTFGQQRPAGLVEPPPEEEKDDAAEPVANKKKRAHSSNAANPPANESKRKRLSKAGRAQTTTEEQAAADSVERPPLVTPEEMRRIKEIHAAQDRASEMEAVRRAKQEEAEEEELRCGFQKMKHAQHQLRKHVHLEAGFQADAADETADESVEGPAFDPVQFRFANDNG